MSEKQDARQARMAETVRLIVTRRERAPRSPRLERAYKRIIWRYVRPEEREQKDRYAKG